MGNLDPYTELSIRAKAAGGPEEFIEKVAAEANAAGFAKGVIVTVVVGAVVFGAGIGAFALVKKYKTRQAEEIAAATADAIAKAETRRSFTVHTTREMQGALTLTVGDTFNALTRDGDVIMIGVDGRTDNPFFVSGAELEPISDFKLDDIDNV